MYSQNQTVLETGDIRYISAKLKSPMSARKEEEMARAMRYRAVLAWQIKDIREGRSGDPGSHVMTPIEASLNRPLLVSMKERKFEGFNSTLG